MTQGLSDVGTDLYWDQNNLVNWDWDWLFGECDRDFNIASGNSSEIVKSGDGNYYKRFIMGPEHKLRNEFEKLEREIEKFKQKEIQRNF